MTLHGKAFCLDDYFVGENDARSYDEAMGFSLIAQRKGQASD